MLFHILNAHLNNEIIRTAEILSQNDEIKHAYANISKLMHTSFLWNIPAASAAGTFVSRKTFKRQTTYKLSKNHI